MSQNGRFSSETISRNLSNWRKVETINQGERATVGGLDVIIMAFPFLLVSMLSVHDTAFCTNTSGNWFQSLEVGKNKGERKVLSET